MLETVNKIGEMCGELETIENALVLVYSNLIANGSTRDWAHEKNGSVMSIALDQLRALKGRMDNIEQRVTEHYEHLKAAYASERGV